MLRVIIAFLASVLTGVQIFFIYTDGKTVCFNNGCEIVDSLTTVSPLYFNIAGFVFFQLIFWCMMLGRKGSEYWYKFAGILLLAGLAAEAVMVFFQYRIALVFCSYCLVVLSFVLLLNILLGLRQIFRGVIIFSAVMIACFSLQFNGREEPVTSLDDGSIAMVDGGQEGQQLYLFFSSTCAHCEQVIEYLKEENSCTIRFNPVDRIEGFTFPGVSYFTDYDPAVNFKFLKILSLKEVPVLISMGSQNIEVIKGGQGIQQYLGDKCRPKDLSDFSGSTSIEEPGYVFLPPPPSPQDDGCELDTNCDDEVKKISKAE